MRKICSENINVLFPSFIHILNLKKKIFHCILVTKTFFKRGVNYLFICLVIIICIRLWRLLQPREIWNASDTITLLYFRTSTFSCTEHCWRPPSLETHPSTVHSTYRNVKTYAPPPWRRNRLCRDSFQYVPRSISYFRVPV